jgi:glycerol-1-phosphate dehydrogenase [NAD(P)+]
MNQTIPYLVVPDAVPPLIDFCQEGGLRRFFLVADPNTYRVLGQRVESALCANEIDVKTILLTGDEIITDEHYIVQALVETKGEDRPFIAVGSGTVTDITRFISHRSREFFISLPTAPSVDGYTSIVAPMVVGKYKTPVPAQPPVAVFADLPTLCAAPQAMIAAGLGDLIGKYTSLADWRLGALLNDEPYNAEIDQYILSSVDAAVSEISLVANASCDGITRLMDGLVGSGFGMLAFGDSRPASGSEHHIAHFWEMKGIMEGKPANLHGAEVGIATALSARRYAMLRQVTRAEAGRMLAMRSLPDHEQMMAEIKAGYGPVAAQIVQIQAPLFKMTAAELEFLKERILKNWDKIQVIARSVPPPEQIEAWLAAVNAPILPQDIGLSPAEAILGLQSAHYLRDRFTLNRLGYWLGLTLPG